MARRRIALTIEADSMIELDPEKYQRLLEDHPSANSAKKQESLIEKLLDGRDGDPISRDALAEMVGAEGGYDKYYDGKVHAFLQEYCETHKHWWDMAGSKSQCQWCYEDRKVAEQKRAEEREAAKVEAAS